MIQAAWLPYALGSAFFAALTAILGKIGVQQMNSNLATFIRTVVILGVLGGVVTLRSEWQRPEQISTVGWVALLLSGVATGASWLCYYRALQLGPVSQVAPIDKLSVAIALILAAIFLREKITWQTVTGVALILSGTFLIGWGK